MNRPRGITPAMFDAFTRAFFYAGINPEKNSEGGKRFVQTIGNAAASAGTHAQDGTVSVGGVEYDYCAAVDLSVRGLNEHQIRLLLQELAKQGIGGWYRHTGSFANNRHIHCIYFGIKMKPMLQRQCVDFLNDRTGLVGHSHETFFTAPPELDAPLKAAFLRANPSAKKFF